MGREARARRGRTRTTPAATVPAWLDKDGLHALVPGSEPSVAELDEMTRRYQENIRARRCGIRWWSSLVRRRPRHSFGSAARSSVDGGDRRRSVITARPIYAAVHESLGGECGL